MAYREHMRERALADWRHRMLVWASRTAFATNPPKPPEIPRILRSDDRGHA